MTINVVCRKDAINRNHLAPLALVFTHDRRRKFVGLGISEALVHWDFDKQQPTADCPDRAEIQFQITSKIREYEKKIKKLEVLEIPVTFDTLFEQNGKRINCTVGEYFKQIIERLEKVEKYSSASKHQVTLVLVSQFRSVNMRFDELDLTYLREFEIFLSQKGNVNNSCNYAAFQYCRLYLIEIPHQTTTPSASFSVCLCCILSKFHIKPQLAACPFLRIQVVSYRNSTSNHNHECRRQSEDRLYLIEIPHQTTTKHSIGLSGWMLYLIEIPHQTTTFRLLKLKSLSCILSKFHIKPQRPTLRSITGRCCILSKFHIKPQLIWQANAKVLGCILSKFHIKPQLNPVFDVVFHVVSYRNSTSNHNIQTIIPAASAVVSYRNSTSNHNYRG